MLLVVSLVKVLEKSCNFYGNTSRTNSRIRSRSNIIISKGDSINGRSSRNIVE